MMRRLALVFLCLVPVASFGGSEIALMPEELEMELALSAAPVHLRADATVLLLGKQGYAEARRGTNGFTCLVGRTQPKDVAPMCYDAEGARTIVPRIADEAAMRARGESEESIRKVVDEGYRTGKYKAPARPGISYMISAVQELAGPDGVVRTFVPHLMFYAPNLSDADIGGKRGGAVFVNSPAPQGMIIVPLGKEEQKAIYTEHEALVKKVRVFLEQSP